MFLKEYILKLLLTGLLVNISSLVYFRELQNNYCKCYSHCLLTKVIIDNLFDDYMSNLLGGKNH